MNGNDKQGSLEEEAGSAFSKQEKAEPRKVTATPASHEDLNTIVSSSYDRVASPHKKAGNRNTGTDSRTIIIAIALACSVFFAISAYNPDVDLRATTDVLAASIEERWHSTGALPQSLAGIDGFPDNAVEREINDWERKDPEGRLEIFYLQGTAGSYTLLLRQGSSTWHKERGFEAKLVEGE